MSDGSTRRRFFAASAIVPLVAGSTAKAAPGARNSAGENLSGNIPVERVETRLPELEPGGQTSVAVTFAGRRPVQVRLDRLRPAGSSVHTAIWKP
jgi:hypothetical protein